MRIGYWRGVTLAIALISSMATTRAALADGLHNTIPREVLAVDLNTGGPYFAPPIPWGHYAKDGFGDHFGKTKCGICGLFMGKGAGLCGGHGLFNHGGKGGCGLAGCGLLNHVGKGGCGLAGCGLFHHGGQGCGDGGCGDGLGHVQRIKDCGLCKGKGCGLCQSSGAGAPIHALASNQSPGRVVISPQSPPVASSQACVEPGCKLGKGHQHGGSSMGSPCGSCGGKGCGLCGGLGRLFGNHGSACDSCGGKGCGKCGLFGRGNGCGFCGGKGCGKCGLFGRGNGCGFCGGKGCGKCGLGAGLHGKLSGLLHPHKGNIKYFVGPGGPVPLTPGYVPYVNPVRSPRDFLAFPPYTSDGF